MKTKKDEKYTKNELRRLEMLYELLLSADFKVLGKIIDQNAEGGE